MPEQTQDEQRFTELLSFYVNDTLGAEDRAWMDAYLAAHPELHNEKRFVEKLAKLSRETVSPVPEQQRLEQFLGKWRESQPRLSWLRRVKAWLANPIRLPSPALAAVAILVVAQSVLIGTLLTDGAEENTFRGGRLDCVAEPRIRVVFSPAAKHVEVVLLLRKLELTVQDGPSETGEFWLTVPVGRLPSEAQAMLRSSALVEEAVLAPASVDPKCAK